MGCASANASACSATAVHSRYSASSAACCATRSALERTHPFAVAVDGGIGDAPTQRLDCLLALADLRFDPRQLLRGALGRTAALARKLVRFPGRSRRRLHAALQRRIRRLLLRCEAAQVVVVVAKEIAELPGAHFDDAVRDGVHQRPVMGDEQQRAGVAAQRVFQDLAGTDVEMIGGLVEHQEVRWAQEELREREARLLATREYADLLLDVVAREEKRAEVVAQARDVCERRVALQFAEHRPLRVERF